MALERTEKIKILLAIKSLQSQLTNMEKEAGKFDRGCDKSGERMRVSLKRITEEIKAIRAYIQKARYYRDAWKVHHGHKKYIENRKYKEKKYGEVSQVAKFQVVYRCKL